MLLWLLIHFIVTKMAQSVAPKYLFVDKQIKFDVPYSFIKLKPGERVIDRLDSIEDTKGNGGDIGQLVVTILRIIWYSLNSPEINLSIGFNCVMNTTTTVVNSILKGKTQALYLLTQVNNTKFEFIFTNLVAGNNRHFTSVMGVHKAYILSKPYRELKLRSTIVQNKSLKILPLEQVYTTIPGVWNLSSDQGNVGVLIITNVRIVWFADINECFNISLPYLQITSIKIQESKFGLALIIITHELSGGYVLGFRVDPHEKLLSIYKEITTMHKVYTTDPVFGIEYSLRKENKVVAEGPILNDELQDTVEEPTNEISNALTVYALNSTGNKKIKPMYCAELGLSIEPLKEEYTIKSLWNIFS